MLTGHWTYRSFLNRTELVGADPQAALGLIFGEGVFELGQSPDGAVEGGLGMGTGYALRVTGTVSTDGDTPRFELVGEGIEGTATAGWRYDYRGFYGPRWERGVDQPATLVGTVLRALAHGPDAPAGVTAAFIAVRQPAPGPRTRRPLSSLLR